MKIRNIGLELYSVREDLAEDLYGTLEKVKAIGYKGVEFFGEYTHTAEVIADALDKTGLVCCGWHTPWHYVQEDKLEATIAYNKTINNKYIVVPGLPGDLTKSKEGWLTVAKKFNELAKTLKEHGMMIGYHNHHAEFIPFPDGTVPYYLLFDNTDKEVIVQLDNGNALKGDDKIYDVPKRYPGRMTTVHLKPYSFTNGFDTMIGQDDIDLLQFVSLCEEYGKTDWYIVEYESKKLYAPMDGVRLCYEAIEKLGLI
jgi:sugar phosphate isomerase/epimerase